VEKLPDSVAQLRPTHTQSLQAFLLIRVANLFNNKKKQEDLHYRESSGKDRSSTQGPAASGILHQLGFGLLRLVHGRCEGDVSLKS
jgi:hypothetical protein